MNVINYDDDRSVGRVCLHDSGDGRAQTKTTEMTFDEKTMYNVYVIENRTLRTFFFSDFFFFFLILPFFRAQRVTEIHIIVRVAFFLFTLVGSIKKKKIKPRAEKKKDLLPVVVVSRTEHTRTIYVYTRVFDSSSTEFST